MQQRLGEFVWTPILERAIYAQLHQEETVDCSVHFPFKMVDHMWTQVHKRIGQFTILHAN